MIVDRSVFPLTKQLAKTAGESRKIVPGEREVMKSSAKGGGQLVQISRFSSCHQDIKPFRGLPGTLEGGHMAKQRYQPYLNSPNAQNSDDMQNARPAMLRGLHIYRPSDRRNRGAAETRS